MKIEVTNYSKFGITCRDQEFESEDDARKWAQGIIAIAPTRTRITLYNKETNHVEWLQNW